MSRSKKLGSIYANNRKRRVVSDDEHSEDESIVENVNHSASNSAESMKRNNHHNHADNCHKIDPVERCQGTCFCQPTKCIVRVFMFIR